MGSPFVGEIRIVGFNFAPVGWAFCNGQLMAIAQSEVLFNLIGTTYGGDGVTTFQLPDLQSRVALHQGNDGLGSSYVIGQSGGQESVTLVGTQLPPHAHAVQAASSANASAPGPGVVIGQPAAAIPAYAATSNTNLNAGAVTGGGGGQPHDNRQPFLATNFIISLFGIFPSQN